MNQERTYGIELEFGCKISIPGLATKLNNAFIAAGSNHRAIGTGYYHHNTDANNVLNWDVKTDSSIQAPDVNSEYPYGIEIASPVLKGTDGLNALKIVCGVLDGITKVGKTTGLHVHHGVRASEIKKIAMSWGKIQSAIYKMLPLSRRNNRFCASWTMRYDGSGNIRSWYRRNVGTRYVGLNLESYWIRGTVEFRMAAGSTDYEKISNWAIYTQLLIDNAARISAVSSDLSHEKIANLLLNVRVINSSYSPKEGTIGHFCKELIINTNLTNQEIANQAIQKFGGNTTANCITWYRNKIRKSTIHTVDTTASVASLTDTLDAAAIAWATQRYNHFNAAA